VCCSLSPALKPLSYSLADRLSAGGSLRRFETTAEAVDGRGRRRLWVEYRRGGAASEGRRRHHVIGGYRDTGGDDGEQGKWRSASLQGCPREVRLLLATRRETAERQ